MSSGLPELRRGIEQRLAFIEFRLFWEGRVNRSDLIDAFSVSVNQASADLSRYLEIAPDNMAYDTRGRAYVRTAAFSPVFRAPEAAHYLAQLHLLRQGIIARADAWLGRWPDFEASPTPVRGVSAEMLRTVLHAIEHADAIEVRYQSMSQPEPAWRWVAPHALGFDGFRWHARAWCFKENSFKDFLLSRMLKHRATRSSEIDTTADDAWHDLIELTIAPHPGLSPAQKKVIALDYEMQNGVTRILVRRAMLYYALKRLGLDESAAMRSPQEQQVVLVSPNCTGGQDGELVHE